MINLDEAIAHYEKKAEECERDSHFDTDYVCYQMSEAERKELRECASEHRQLAEWLKKLKAYEEAREEIIRKRDSGQWSETVVFGFNRAIRIIDKHLKEVNADE